MQHETSMPRTTSAALIIAALLGLLVATAGCVQRMKVGEHADTTEGTDAGPTHDGNESDADGELGAPVSLQVLEARYAKAICKGAYHCCSAGEIPQIPPGSIDVDVSNADISKEEACPTATELVADDTAAAVRKAADAGRIEYDAVAMGACLERIASSSCSGIPVEGPPPFGCGNAIEPMGEPGATCRRDFECKGGFCQKISGEDETGSCQRFAREGEDCENAECAEGLYCNPRGDTCATASAEQGETCWETGKSACETGICASAESGGRTCQDKKKGGEKCTTDDVCVSGLCHDDAHECLPAPACDGQ